MERIKTNIIELSKLYKKPCEVWLKRFKHDKLDAHQAFKEHGNQYLWLYENSPYDLIDWDRHSCHVARYCSEHLDPNKYNWQRHSWVVAKYCPNKIDPEKYNWEKHGGAIAKYCPDKLDPQRFNWEKDRWLVEMFCPEKLKLLNKKQQIN